MWFGEVHLSLEKHKNPRGHYIVSQNKNSYSVIVLWINHTSNYAYITALHLKMQIKKKKQYLLALYTKYDKSRSNVICTRIIKYEKWYIL